MKHHYLSTLALSGGLLATSLSASAQNIIPLPKQYEAGQGKFVFAAGMKVYSGQLADSLKPEAQRFVEVMNKATGLGLITTDTTADGAAVTCTVTTAAATGPEGYTLNVTDKGITVGAATSAGFFHAFQSLKMLLPRNVMAEMPDTSVTSYSVPACSINDAPRMAYRGFMLDEGRHFFGMDEVKRILDIMAYYKLNRFHWHLTDDQGWRIEIKKYPRLTTVGSVRQGSNTRIPGYDLYRSYDQYGPYFYTQEQVKEIIAYAKERHIEVIPEVEMPGHLAAAMTAYPEFSCDPYGSHKVWVDGGISSDVLNVANPKAVQFAKDILDEIASLFPSKYIHIGGDECPTTAWQNNAECQALMKELKLSNIRALQSHFTHELAQYMANKKAPAQRRKLICWNESVTAGGSDTQLLKGDGLTIMCWTGAENASKVAENLGMATIVTPQPQYYINRTAWPGDSVGNAGNGNDATLKIVYEHKPSIRSKTIGIQGTFWTEHVSNSFSLEYLAIPRLMAIAESSWTPEAQRNFDNFVERLRVDTVLYKYRGYAWAPHYVRKASESVSRVMPAAGSYYQLMSRADGSRSGRAVTLLSKDAPALAKYKSNGAAVGLLWSDTAIDESAAAADTLRKYQLWQFVEDPKNPGKYAMVCQAFPDGSVSATANGSGTSATWSYDYNTRHYNFVLGENSYYGKDGNSYYYSIRSDQYNGQYMNVAADGKQLRINLYGNPADGNGGLFTFKGEEKNPEKPLTDGATYRIENTSPTFPGLRLSDNGASTLGYSTQPWCNDAWTITATASSEGVQTITMTNAATGRSVTSVGQPVMLGTGQKANLKVTYDADRNDYKLSDKDNKYLIPIGLRYCINPGTLYAMAGAIMPQGTNYRFVEVVRATYTAKDEDGNLIGTYTQSIEKGKPYTPAAPVIENYELVTDPTTLKGTENATTDLSYTVVYRRKAYSATLRSQDNHGILISETTQVVAADEAGQYSWQAPQWDYYTFLSASADKEFPLVKDTVVNLTYESEALPSFAEALQPVDEVEDGKYYLIYDAHNDRYGYLNLHPLTNQILTTYLPAGSPAYVWKAIKQGNAYQFQNINGLYMPTTAKNSAHTAGKLGGLFTLKRDGTTWSVKDNASGLYWNGNAGSFTGWSDAHPYQFFEFRTEPYFTLTYHCITEEGNPVQNGTYTFYVAAGSSYTLEQPVSTPAAYPVVECSESDSTGTMKGNLTVTYTFKKKTGTGIADIDAQAARQNGQWHDLSGRRVARPSKGIYIRKGEKVFINP